MDQDSQPNRILVVTINQLLYPITTQVLYQVFSPYGFVEKIVTHPELPSSPSFIQYQSCWNAVVARKCLQGRNVYDDCCTLQIQFSYLSELQVYYNNARSWDFTNLYLPSGQKRRMRDRKTQDVRPDRRFDTLEDKSHVDDNVATDQGEIGNQVKVETDGPNENVTSNNSIPIGEMTTSEGHQDVIDGLIETESVIHGRIEMEIVINDPIEIENAFNGLIADVPP